MNSHLSIAAVTATLRQLLLTSLLADLEGLEVNVTTGRPGAHPGEDAQQKPGVNIFLYQVQPSPAWRNNDLPTRSATGQLARRPRLGLTLDYLLSFTGSEATLDAQRLLGSSARALHVEPVLRRSLIEEAITASKSKGEFLSEAGLAAQVEQVRLTPLPLSLEELSKLWSVLVQTPYALSVAYQAAVVLIEPDVEPRRAAPVTSVVLRAGPSERQEQT